jgi:hypothetical protein
MRRPEELVRHDQLPQTVANVGQTCEHGAPEPCGAPADVSIWMDFGVTRHSWRHSWTEWRVLCMDHFLSWELPYNARALPLTEHARKSPDPDPQAATRSKGGSHMRIDETELGKGDEGMAIQDDIRGRVPGFDGTFHGTCIRCFRPTDTGFAIRGVVEAPTALLTLLGIPEDEAAKTMSACSADLFGTPPGTWADGVRDWPFLCCRTCADAVSPYPIPVGLVALGVPLLTDPRWEELPPEDA